MKLKNLAVMLAVVCLFVFLGGFSCNVQAQQTERQIKVIVYDIGDPITDYQSPEYIEASMWQAGRLIAERYPNYELGDIDGIPWQRTEYADDIKKGIQDFFETTKVSGTFLADNREFLTIVYDERLNGKGIEAKRLYSQGKTIEQIIEILAPSTPGNTNTNNLGNNPVLPAPDSKRKAVLYLNSKDCSLSDGQTWTGKKLDVAPTIEANRTLIPLRGVLDFMGATLDWNQNTRQVTAKLGSKEVVLTINSKAALVNGKLVTLDVLTRTVNGRTLIPLRFVSEQLGLNVVWDSKQDGVITISE